MELKLMMEKLGAPQTHLGLKSMIKEVDEDFDGKLSLREVPATCRPGPGGAVALRGPGPPGALEDRGLNASPEGCLEVSPIVPLLKIT